MAVYFKGMTTEEISPYDHEDGPNGGNSLICQLFQGSRWTNTDWWCGRQGNLGLGAFGCEFRSAGCQNERPWLRPHRWNY